MDDKVNDENFYLRLIYGGVTLYADHLGSGEITKYDGTQVRYTLKPTVILNDPKTEGCVEWKLGGKLKKGEYTVELYNNGYLVGTDQFKLK